MVDQRPEDELNPPAVEAEAEADGSDREWWDDAAMPWKHKPTRQDIACLAWIGFLGVFSMAMLPLRAWLLGAPERLPWLVGLMGSRTGTAALGSLVRVGTDVPFVLPILFGALMSISHHAPSSSGAPSGCTCPFSSQTSCVFVCASVQSVLPSGQEAVSVSSRNVYPSALPSVTEAPAQAVKLAAICFSSCPS